MSCPTCGAEGWGFHICFDTLLERLAKALREIAALDPYDTVSMDRAIELAKEAPAGTARKLREIYIAQAVRARDKEDRVRELEFEVFFLNEVQYKFWRELQ